MKFVETESLRSYKVKTNDTIRKMHKEGIKVKYKGKEFSLTGFKVAKFKDKSILAYKIKPDTETQELMLLYYSNGKQSDEAFEVLKEKVTSSFPSISIQNAKEEIVNAFDSLKLFD